jgi:hypothetical protein
MPGVRHTSMFSPPVRVRWPIFGGLSAHLARPLHCPAPIEFIIEVDGT